MSHAIPNIFMHVGKLSSSTNSQFVRKFSVYNGPTQLFHYKRKLLNHSDSQNVPCRFYAMRLELSEYGIIWRRPEKIMYWRPEKSGELKPFEAVDVTQPVVYISPAAKELEKASEMAKKLLSIEFSSERDVVEKAKYNMKRRIQRHQFDEGSLEVRIALMTVDIRYLQQFVMANPKKVGVRQVLHNKIFRRRHLLMNLRELDYPCFEWLIEQLGIHYKPLPPSQELVSRKSSLKKLVELHCSSLRETKMDEFRKELDKLKGPFLDEKRDTLKWIAETEKRLGLPRTVEIPEDGGDPEFLPPPPDPPKIARMKKNLS